MARSLHSAGLDLGSDLLGAEPANPYGHFEDRAAVEMHDRLLAAGERTWKSLEPMAERRSVEHEISAYVDTRSKASAGGLWGVKDPRVCLFLSEWLRAVPDAAVVFVLRAPGPAVDSLHRRHIRRHVDTGGIDPSDLDFWRVPDLGLRLWVHYHREALRSLAEDRGAATEVHVIEFADPDLVDQRVASVAQSLGLRGEPAPLDRSLGEFHTLPVLDPSLIPIAGRVYCDVLAVAGEST